MIPVCTVILYAYILSTSFFKVVEKIFLIIMIIIHVYMYTLLKKQKNKNSVQNFKDNSVLK